jgi:hypothetical protein
MLVLKRMYSHVRIPLLQSRELFIYTLLRMGEYNIYVHDLQISCPEKTIDSNKESWEMTIEFWKTRKNIKIPERAEVENM